MDQNLVNIGVGIAITAGGWWMKTIWEGVKSLTKEVADLRVLVAGQYVSKDSHDKLLTAIFSKLDRIEDKLDKKVDKE